jgi:DNA replication and repair protein RecF
LDINCFVGNNGAKTNILDALHYISMGKSFLGNSDFQNIKENENFFNIEAEIEGEEKNDIIKIYFKKKLKKSSKKTKKPTKEWQIILVFCQV